MTDATVRKRIKYEVDSPYDMTCDMSCNVASRMLVRLLQRAFLVRVVRSLSNQRV